MGSQAEVEQCGRPRTRKEGPRAVEVAPRLQPVGPMTDLQGQPRHGVIDPVAEFFIEASADPNQDAAANDVEKACARNRPAARNSSATSVGTLRLGSTRSSISSLKIAPVSMRMLPMPLISAVATKRRGRTRAPARVPNAELDWVAECAAASISILRGSSTKVQRATILPAVRSYQQARSTGFKLENWLTMQGFK